MNQNSLLRTSVLMLAALLHAGCGETGTSERTSPVAVATETRVLGVNGMHCDGCVNAVTTKVSRVEGVESCVVSLEAETATIIADPAAFADAQAAIEKLGYKVTPVSE
jgi:copper chaperone CopZ